MPPCWSVVEAGFFQGHVLHHCPMPPSRVDGKRKVAWEMPPLLPPQTLKSHLTVLSSQQSSPSLGGITSPRATSEFTRPGPVWLSYTSSSDFKGSHTGWLNNDRLRWPRNRKQFNTVLSGPDRQMKHQILARYKLQASQRYFLFVCFSHATWLLSDCRRPPLWGLQDDCHVVKSFSSLSYFLISKEGLESPQHWFFLFKDLLVLD